MELRERTAIVTGASRGLGREIARAFADRGAHLVLTARGSEDLERVAEELSDRTEVLALALDVSEDAERLVEAATARFGGVDVLVNNASELGRRRSRRSKRSTGAPSSACCGSTS